MSKHLVLCLTTILSLGALSACSQQNIPSPKANSSAQQTSNNTQSSAANGGNTNSEGFLSAPVVAPPSYDDRPPNPGETPQADKLPNGLPALKPLKGVNVDTLFSENITNTDRRFERVENAVVEMRREFEAVKPAIVRLVAVEEDIQNMVEQLEAMAMQEQTSSVSPVYQEPISDPQQLVPSDLQEAPQTSNYGAVQKMEPKPESVQNKTMSPSHSGAGAMVKNLRTGRHSNKIRLVLDMSANSPHTVDLDSSENILVIELPDAHWSGSSTKAFGSKEPLLASYSVEKINNGNGSRIVIPLKKSTSILKTDVLPPGHTPNYRMYIDLSI